MSTTRRKAADLTPSKVRTLQIAVMGGRSQTAQLYCRFTHEVDGELIAFAVTRDPAGRGKRVTHVASGLSVCGLLAGVSYLPGYRTLKETDTARAKRTLDALCAQVGATRVRERLLAAKPLAVKPSTDAPVAVPAKPKQPKQRKPADDSLTAHALEGYRGEHCAHIWSSPAYYAHHLGRHLHATGRPEPRDVQMSRGNRIRVSDMLFRFHDYPGRTLFERES